MALDEGAGTFGAKEMQMCQDANNELDNITDVEKYFMADETLDAFNASCSHAAPYMTEKTKTLVISLQACMGPFNDEADNINYEMVDKLKGLADLVTADDDCMNELRKLNETGQLSLAPISIAHQAKNLTAEFREAANHLYLEAKHKLVENMDDINREVEALTQDLRINATNCDSRIESLTEAFKVASKSLESGNKVTEEFAAHVTPLALAVQQHFTEMAEQIRNLTQHPTGGATEPQRAAEPQHSAEPQSAPAPEIGE